jgi:hypothetical protein
MWWTPRSGLRQRKEIVFGRGRADEEGWDEAGTLSDGNEVDIPWCEFG